MPKRFLLICGVFGVGKTAIIREIISADDSFCYIAPFMTRPLRAGETDKISIGEWDFAGMEKEGKFLLVNEYFGIRYGTPKDPIAACFAAGKACVLDWQAKDLEKIISLYGPEIFAVYLLPPSLEILEKRLLAVGRNSSPERLKEARDEIENLKSAAYRESINLTLVNEENRQAEIAREIIAKFSESQ